MGLFKRKKKTQEKPAKIGEIYETTDGFFQKQPSKNDKRRMVVVTQRRNRDGAGAVNKLHGVEENEVKKYTIPNLTLNPKQHSSLTKKSVVDHRSYWGKHKNSAPIYKGDLVAKNDRLTHKERQQVKKGLGGPKKEHKKTYRNTVRKWKRNFNNKK